MLDRIDRGHAKHETDARVGSRSAALAQDPAPACFPHDRVDGQKVWRVAELANQPHFVRYLVGIGLRHVVIEHPLDRFCGQLLERFLGRQTIDQLLMRVLILKLAKIEGADPRNVDTRLQCVGISAEAPDHLIGRFQRAIGVHLAAIAKLVDGAFLAHRGHHVLQQPRFRSMVEHVASHDRAHCRSASLSRQRIDADRVPWPAPLEQRHVAPTPIDGLQILQRSKVLFVRLMRKQNCDDAFRPWFQIVPVQQATALSRPLLSDGQQSGDPRPGRAIRWVKQQATATR
jgi:hypothetical protein